MLLSPFYENAQLKFWLMASIVICFTPCVCYNHRRFVNFPLLAAPGAKTQTSSTTERRYFYVRDYELTIILQPDLDEDGRKAVIAQVTNWITGGNEAAEQPTINQWGQRQLAYQINKLKSGYYVLYEAKMDPAAVNGLERNLFYHDDVIRYLIVRADEAADGFDYKQFNVLRDYITEYGQIVPRRRNRISARQQRNLAQAVKRARHLALLPFVVD